MILKFSLAVQLAGRQANVSFDLLVMSFLHKKRRKDKLKRTKRGVYKYWKVLMDLIKLCIVVDQILLDF